MALPHDVKHGRFYSPSLGREMGLTVLVPAGYAPLASHRYPVLYLLPGGSSSHREWSDRMPLAQMLAPHPMLVVMPEGENSLYVNGHSGECFEDYVIEDLPRFIESEFRVEKRRGARALAGLSMGGFAAFNLGLTHLDRYAVLASLSAAFGMTWWNMGKREDLPFHRALGPVGSETRAAYDPWRILERTIAQNRPSDLPAMRIAVGTEDDPEVVLANQNYHRSLLGGSVAHLYKESPGGHDWGYWTRETPELLAFVAEQLSLESQRPNDRRS